jgi:hypothetical protein
LHCTINNVLWLDSTQALRNIDAENCQAIALCSFFVALVAIVLPAANGSQVMMDPAMEIVVLRNLFQGSQAILDQKLMDGEMGLYFRAVIKPERVQFISTERYLSSPLCNTPLDGFGH